MSVRRLSPRRPPGQEDREIVARQNAAARSEHSPDDRWPPARRDMRPLIMMACAVVAVAAIVLGLTWFSRSPTFGGERAPVSERQ